MLTTSITASPQLSDLVASLLLGFLTAALLPGLIQALSRDQAHRRRAWLVVTVTLTLFAAIASLLLGIRWNITAHYTDPSVRINVIQGIAYSFAIASGLFLGLWWAHRQKP